MIAVAILVLSSCCDDKCTEPTGDAPIVTIENVSSGDEILGTKMIYVNVISEYETDVLLFLDGSEVPQSSPNRSILWFDSNNYDDGLHSLKAKAIDSEGREGTSETKQIYTRYDFAPDSNGEIAVSINYYEQLDDMDAYSFGDPYFVFELLIDDEEFGTFTSEVFENTAISDTTITCCFDISDNTRAYTLNVHVFDADAVQDDEEMDYTSCDTTYYHTFELEPYNSDFALFYSGEDDGSADIDDNDCIIGLTVQTVTD